MGIPDDYRPETDEMFDPAVMQRLFDMGYAAATSSDPWATSLPGISGRMKGERGGAHE